LFVVFIVKNYYSFQPMSSFKKIQWVFPSGICHQSPLRNRIWTTGQSNGLVTEIACSHFKKNLIPMDYG